MIQKWNRGSLSVVKTAQDAARKRKGHAVPRRAYK
jgi:hypothetical protein